MRKVTGKMQRESRFHRGSRKNRAAYRDRTGLRLPGVSDAVPRRWPVLQEPRCPASGRISDADRCAEQRAGNLYREDGVEHLLPRRVDEVRAELGLASPAPRPRLRDLAAVISLGVPMLAVMATPLLAVLALPRALA